MMSRSEPGKSSATLAINRIVSGGSLAPTGRTSGRSDCFIKIAPVLAGGGRLAPQRTAGLTRCGLCRLDHVFEFLLDHVFEFGLEFFYEAVV
jgi:hypothetical protein